MKLAPACVVATVLLAAMSCTLAQTVAETHDDADLVSDWSFSGYGTLGYSQVMNDVPYVFVRDPSQPMPTAPKKGSWRADSRIGVQLGYRLSPQTDVVVQAVLRDKAEPTLQNDIEWAYVSHRPTDNLTLRVGRVGIDAFLLSDYRNLGYAQTTLRPNSDYYGFIPFYAGDGIDASYSFNTGAARWTVKSQWGRTQANVPIIAGEAAYNFLVDPYWDVSVLREAGPWRIKAGYAELKVVNDPPLSAYSLPLSQLAALGIPGVSAEAAYIAQETSFKDSRIGFLSVEASYDDGTWVAQGEISRVTAQRRALTQGAAHYLNFGRRIGNLTPYLTVSGFRPAKPAATAQYDWASLLASPLAGALQASTLFGVNMMRIDQNTLSLGLRWDFHPQAAFKLQWDHVKVRPNGFGLWRSFDSASTAAGQINLLSASIDWVF